MLSDWAPMYGKACQAKENLNDDDYQQNDNSDSDIPPPFSLDPFAFLTELIVVEPPDAYLDSHRGKEYITLVFYCINPLSLQGLNLRPLAIVIQTVSMSRIPQVRPFNVHM